MSKDNSKKEPTLIGPIVGVIMLIVLTISILGQNAAWEKGKEFLGFFGIHF